MCRRPWLLLGLEQRQVGELDEIHENATQAFKAPRPTANAKGKRATYRPTAYFGHRGGVDRPALARLILAPGARCGEVGWRRENNHSLTQLGAEMHPQTPAGRSRCIFRPSSCKAQDRRELTRHDVVPGLSHTFAAYAPGVSSGWALWRRLERTSK